MVGVMVTDGVIVRFGKLLRFGKEFMERGGIVVAGDILILEEAIAERGDCSILALLFERYRGIPLIDEGDDKLLLALLRLWRNNI